MKVAILILEKGEKIYEKIYVFIRSCLDGTNG